MNFMDIHRSVELSCGRFEGCSSTTPHAQPVRHSKRNIFPLQACKGRNLSKSPTYVVVYSTLSNTGGSLSGDHKKSRHKATTRRLCTKKLYTLPTVYRGTVARSIQH